jgi:prephenate dehydrogenase
MREAVKMDELSGLRVGIVGLGLMGGSLALALRGKCARLFGIDPDAETLKLASAMGIVDQAAQNPLELLPESDLIVLAAPVKANLALLDQLGELQPGAAMVLDLSSTKAQIVQAMSSLPERFDPLGGHPMCGKERGGLANAEPQIFQGAAFVFTPLVRSSLRIRAVAEELARAIGSYPVWLDALTHDRWVASTSHLPFLVANALAAVTPVQARSLIGPGLRSTTRLAPSPWPIMRDILDTNQDNILAVIRLFSERIKAMEALLQSGEIDNLAELVNEGAQNYNRLVN